ncbi:bifunctional hydroxymethylpyrimidine kinase/phosphomethylpyrimidine kinase [Hydrogenophaga sp. PAMC20947]|uniref:bifunctional hydroxymethylpyrimidine kinase/phosphomethylpyrimidine kinase n=1 Tax=Hydrogenophaga sp. PAMC20947 TaxID=2565558 RepID=UPI00109DB898|nr:bifunctional hydroxymethylpyrimidine kinase/phosphomethylpyrimidine kinase [Hydrogenophaga sp. PAMC20947]QCB44619.1 bifunctional hydroxymethylpyrimidine kinase/phosphomethylpyrimidine kinase [Hydrogenophaga sp. PAMC20947]
MTPIIWSIAGTDSGGGAGLAADQRAADACGVHLCTAVAAVTAQNTVAVSQVQAITPELLDAQLAALASDLPPRVIKTGLLGSAANAHVVARWIDRLRQRGPVQLVVDPVLRASTGAPFADAELLQAYREALLPRASVITPNQHEAQALLGDAEVGDMPAMARALLALGTEAVCITGGDASETLSHDWLHTPHAQGWLSLPRVDTPHHHGTGCTFATSLASALARGFVSADAAVFAKMATTHALRQARAIGKGAGPVIATSGFEHQADLLPHLSLDHQAPDHWVTRHRAPDPGVYAIVDSAERVEAVLRVAPTVTTLQLRMKRDPQLSDGHWRSQLNDNIRRSQRAADAAGVTLFINDHWQAALDVGAQALHLGQEDLLALSAQNRERLQEARATGVRLGLSSHSLWELCRAAALAPDYIACGPIWPTTTKDMPWEPQGLDNLAWWVHMSPAPVVGIGGILGPEQLRAVAGTGAASGCVVRGLGKDPASTLPAWLTAWLAGQASAGSHAKARAHGWPHPALSLAPAQAHSTKRG